MVFNTLITKLKSLNKIADPSGKCCREKSILPCHINLSWLPQPNQTYVLQDATHAV